MSDLNTAVEKEIDEIIKILTENKNSARAFHKTKALMDENDKDKAKLIPHKLAALSLKSVDSATPTQLCIQSYMCSAAFAIQSQRDLKDGNNSEALYSFRKASYFFGRAIGSVISHVGDIEERNVIENIAELIKKGGSKGGRQKDKNLDPIINKAAELLSTLKSDGGWSSKADAAKHIVDRLNEFIRNYRLNNPNKALSISESEDRRIDLILDWIRERPIVTDAYQANASQKALKRIKKNKLNGPEDGLATPSVEL